MTEPNREENARAEMLRAEQTLLAAEALQPADRDGIIEAAVHCSSGDVVLSPLILTVAELDALRARELLIAGDIDREGIVL